MRARRGAWVDHLAAQGRKGRAVAEAAGLNPDYLRQVRAGKPCSKTAAVALSAVMGVPLEALFVDDEQPAGGGQEG